MSGEPGIDCHSTWILFCLPQSTKTAPTASSVTTFQLAKNQTLNLPEMIVRSFVGAVVAAAATAVPPALAAGACPPPPPAAGALLAVAAAPPQAARNADPASVATPLRNCRRDKGTARRCCSMLRSFTCLPRRDSLTGPGGKGTILLTLTGPRRCCYWGGNADEVSEREGP